MNKLRNIGDRLYRLSALAEMGRIGLFSLGLLMLFTLGLFVFTDFQNQVDEQIQYAEIDAVEVKNDSDIFHKFLKGVKTNNGVLVLGTSESGSLEGYNYWELLNRDSSIDRKFSVFYGAGRFCEKYFPSIINNPEIWQGMEILVFINPTYWREGLNGYNAAYQERYMNTQLISEARSHFTDKETFDFIYGGGLDIKYFSLKQLISNIVDSKLKVLYSKNLNSLLGRQEQVVFPFPNGESAALLMDEYRLSEKKKLVNLKYNCIDSYLKEHPDAGLIPVDKGSDYRYKVLKVMFELCAKHNIKAHYIIGPYNGVLAKNMEDKNVFQDYKVLCSEIVSFFKSNKQSITDLTNLSEESGTFIDPQHHSAYGGAMIYDRLKTHYYE